MKSLKNVFFVIGLAATFYFCFNIYQYFHRISTYESICNKIQEGMSIKDIEVVSRRSFSELLQECEFGKISDDSSSNIFIVFPASPLASSPPTVTVDLFTKKVSDVSCIDH